MERFIPYAQPNITDEDRQCVIESLGSPIITRGEKVKAFENSVASYCGAKYAVAFNSATTALFAACHAAGLGSNDRLLTSPNTFIATIGPTYPSKATPIFIDIDIKTGCLDLELLSMNIPHRSTRGRTFILPVHFSGIPIDMHYLDSCIRDPNVVVIEDASHALGSRYKEGYPVGSCAWSQMTIFSFHPAKTITTGEGGMVTTNDPDLYHQLQLFRNNGIERDPQFFMENSKNLEPWYYEVQQVTGNYNFTEFQAALGISQMLKLDQFVIKRRRLVALYRKFLSKVPNLTLFSEACDQHTSFHLMVVQIDYEAYKTTRTAVMKALQEKGIGTQVHYIPLYRHPHFKRTHGDISEYFPKSEAYYSQALTLPLYYDLSEKDIENIVSALKQVLNNSSYAK